MQLPTENRVNSTADNDDEAAGVHISRPTPINAGTPSSVPSPSPPKLLPPPPRICSGVNPSPWSGTMRPLSDIRELSEPSMLDNIPRKPGVTFEHRRSTSKSSPTQEKRSLRLVASDKFAKPVAEVLHEHTKSQDNGSSSYSTTPEQLNVHGVPHASVPQRSSSRTQSQRPRKGQTKDVRTPISADAPASAPNYTIRNHEQGFSPRKDVRYDQEHLQLHEECRPPPQTKVRDPHPVEVLIFPCYKHPKLKIDMQVSAPMFVGGGSIEGHVKIVVDGHDHLKHRRSLSIGSVSVDLLGFEDVSGGRKATFLALGTDLISASRPPPSEMVDATDTLFTHGAFWPLARSSVALPFVISLPLHTGPPPFRSKHACIRFLLAVTAALRDTGKIYRVRMSRDVHVLPTYDPEKALTSLRSPLTSSDEMTLRQSKGHETVRLGASLHRQVWVSGGNIFVDIAIANMSRRAVKRLELVLERDVLLYKHTAAGTMEKSASQARIFESNEQTVLAKTTFKPGASEWDGVDPQSSDLRTCELALPRGHGTVRCGKYFEVRYFLNVIATVSGSKQVSVQLPIILIHINSLDVLPNSIAQVAAAIEEKRADIQRKRSQTRRLGSRPSRQRSGSSSLGTDLRRRPSYGQGRAFAAPRQQSLDRLREQQAEIDELRHAVDCSPRKYPRTVWSNDPDYKKPFGNQSLNSLVTRSHSPDDVAEVRVELRPKKSYSSSRSENHSLRDRLRGMRSLETFRHRGFRGKSVAQEQTVQAVMPGSTSQLSARQIMPHTLGLSTATFMDNDAQSQGSIPPGQQTTSMGTYERLDRSRLYPEPANKKTRGGLRGKGLGWLERRRSHRSGEKVMDEENWI